jgi:hypothetical protein
MQRVFPCDDDARGRRIIGGDEGGFFVQVPQCRAQPLQLATVRNIEPAKNVDRKRGPGLNDSGDAGARQADRMRPSMAA